MIWALFGLSNIGFVAISLLALFGPKLGWGRYWPPEKPSSWQHQSFRALFRLGLYPLIALSAVLARDNGFAIPSLGFALVLAGFGSALLFTGKLGWTQAFGTAEGLVTKGVYAYSRNPIYVATWVGLLGWGILIPNAVVLLPLLIWALLYAIAPFLEEPWLEREFGAAYLEYKSKTPRFLVI